MVMKFRSPGEIYSTKLNDDDFMFKVMNNYNRFANFYNSERSKKSHTNSFSISRPPQL